MRFLAAAFFVGLAAGGPALAAGQGVTVSGVVTSLDFGAPIRGATISLSSYPPATTSETGGFAFTHVPAGSYVLRVQAIGYQLALFALPLTADTTLAISLERLPTQLDTVVVVGKDVTIEGTIRDAKTKASLLDAQVRLSPGATTAGALTGRFRLRDVPQGEITLLFTAGEHLPREISFVATRDTSLVVDLEIDSVGVRMIAQQAKRLATRANSIPLSVKRLDRAAMAEWGAPTIGILLHRLHPRTFPESPPWPENTCLFLDDNPVHFSFLIGLALNRIERIEVFGSRGQMVRVYSTQYVASLMRMQTLPKILYIPTGLRTVCS